MDGGSSDGLKWSLAWAWPYEMDVTMQLPEFSGAYADYEAAATGLPVPLPELCGATHALGKPNWCSVPSTITSMSLGNPTPHAQALSSREKGENSMREMIFRMAAMQPIHIDPESVKPPKRRNVKISKDPQSVAARHRRERISQRIRILQRLVPGGTKMDIASMLDEAIHYLKFLKSQVHSLQRSASYTPPLPLFNPSSTPLSLYKSSQSAPSHHPHHYGGDV